MIVTELAARALDSHDHTILHVLWNLRPLDGVYLGVDKLLRDVSFHYGYMGRELYCFMIAYFNRLHITADTHHQRLIHILMHIIFDHNSILMCPRSGTNSFDILEIGGRMVVFPQVQLQPIEIQLCYLLSQYPLHFLAIAAVLLLPRLRNRTRIFFNPPMIRIYRRTGRDFPCILRLLILLF